ncbi:MAG: transporter [Bryobacteraceae bacterium]
MSAAYAKEGGDQYAYGAESWFTGALPPPGTYFINYFGFYAATLRDGSGNKVNLGGSTPSVDAVFDALRIVEVTKYKILGASWGMHITAPLVEQSVDMGGRASEANIGDIDVDPFILGWHGKKWHIAAGPDMWLPTGHYDKNDARVSIGTNYVTFQPVVAVTLLPAKGWETSAKFMFDLNTKNDATDYHSGDEFHFDYVAGKHIGPWSVGVCGYLVEQLEDDTVNGQTVAAVPGFWDTGRKGQAFAAGPSVAYSTKKHMEFSFQYQHEMAVRNRFGGDKLWFKMIIPL